jgi:hypothetical protein
MYVTHSPNQLHDFTRFCPDQVVACGNTKMPAPGMKPGHKEVSDAWI